ATTAEGVETQDQLTALALAGCTDVQGYLFSRPVPESEVAKLLLSMPGIKDMLPLGSVIDDDLMSALHPSLRREPAGALS
ncbi:MAG TPA: hypothetical protein VGC09_18485, partial [Rhodopila sp.]